MNEDELTEEDVMRYLEECNESQDIFGFCYIPEIVCSKILDLYQKEKDLNQELQIRYKIENDKYKEEKEKNRELSNLSENIKIFREKNFSDETKYVIALNSNYMNYLKLDYISKDKIREKIEDLEDKVHIVIPNEYNKTEIINEFKNEGAISALKELLEE